MKCSLLTLSTYIDDELAGDRRAEVDAHLVGCSRCSAGAATLREERGRLGQLARVRVAPASTRLMLEQLGITGAPEAPTPRPLPPQPDPSPDSTPWQTAMSSHALPWTPRRPQTPMAPVVVPHPTPRPLPIEEIAGPSVAPDVQPDLPFDGLSVAPAPWDPAAAATDVEGSQEVEPDLRRPSLGDDEHAEDVAIPQDGWEMDLPPPVQAMPMASSRAEPAAVFAPPEPPQMPPPRPVATPAPPTVASAPIRVTPTGPAVLWSRMRDAVAVRMALSRSGEAMDDSVDIVNGTAPRRGAPMAATPPESPSSVELTGVSDALRQPAAARVIIEPLVATAAERTTAPPSWAVDDDEPAADDTPTTDAPESAWNAFAASSYPRLDEIPAVISEPEAGRQLGRHGRAVARDHVDVVQRARRSLAAAAHGIRGERRAGAVGVHATMAAGRTGNRDRRIIAAIAAVAVIFLTALVVGHGSGTTASPTAGRVSPGNVPAHNSAPAASAPASKPAVVPPATSSAPSAALAPAAPQTLGAGATGFQIAGLRYGQQPGYMRIVFDMGPVKGNNGSSPTVTITSSNATTLLVSFAGTLPAGSVGTPPAGTVLSSVSLVSTAGGKSLYRIVVSHPVSANALFLSGTSPPLRLVLDLH